MPKVRIREARKRTTGDRPPFVALCLLGARGTEVMDLLGPYETLAASRLFDVFTVASTSRPAPLSGNLFAVPDYALLEMSADDTAAVIESADVVVVPNVFDAGEPMLLEFLKRYGGGKWVLSVCEGARMVAASGLLESKVAVTHFHALNELGRKHPSVRFLHGHRYIHTGNIITSAGVSAGIDSSLFLIEKMGSPAHADATSDRMEYEGRVRETDPDGKVEGRPPSFTIGTTEGVKLMGRTFSPWGKRVIAVAVMPDVGETLLGAVVDAFPRTGKVKLMTFTPEEQVGPVATAHGLAVLPQFTAGVLKEPVHHVLVPSSQPTKDGQEEDFLKVKRALERRHLGEVPITLLSVPAGKALNEVLDLVQKLIGRKEAALVAKMMEHHWKPDA
ncbi:unnamed protein product [Ostreobium quekettii]|uniref:DJ-1/PfpI domain-containing protein n=1 Tax=Ostreobium quekettii TaxID=121088 RepID=A0A8S1JEB2_9CHLO|nr:unnamed protein product [Ostreobium quekettii]